MLDGQNNNTRHGIYQVKLAIIMCIAAVLVNGFLVHSEITSLLRELARLSVLVSVGYLIYVLIKRPSKPKL